MQGKFLETGASAEIISVCSCVCVWGRESLFSRRKPKKEQQSPSRSHLVLLQATFRHGLVSLLLKGDNDQSHEYVDKEEGEHHKVDHIKDGRLHAEAGVGALVLVSGVHRVLQDPEKEGKIKLTRPSI